MDEDQLEAFRRALGAAVRQYRDQRGLSQAELARRLGIPQQSVSYYEAGGPSREQPASWVFDFEARLGLEPGELSQILGYAPLDACPTVERLLARLSVEAVLGSDPKLPRPQREALVQQYRDAVRRHAP